MWNFLSKFLLPVLPNSYNSRTQIWHHQSDSFLYFVAPAGSLSPNRSALTSSPYAGPYAAARASFFLFFCRIYGETSITRSVRYIGGGRDSAISKARHVPNTETAIRTSPIEFNLVYRAGCCSFRSSVCLLSVMPSVYLFVSFVFIIL